jgi:hypothetical protein
MSFAGKSGNAVEPEPSRLVHVASGVAGLKVTSNTWTRESGRQRTIAAVRYPGMIRVHRIHVYTAYEPTRVVRRRWQCIESGVRNGTCSGIGVCRDEQASCACSNPQGTCVARGTFNRGDATHACSTCAKPIGTVSVPSDQSHQPARSGQSHRTLAGSQAL